MRFHGRMNLADSSFRNLAQNRRLNNSINQLIRSPNGEMTNAEKPLALYSFGQDPEHFAEKCNSLLCDNASLRIYGQHCRIRHHVSASIEDEHARHSIAIISSRHHTPTAGFISSAQVRLA